ncbi:MAG: bifunctional 4-hydroxy-2-oxoglutarate aldolase/2-dehydro-3-deoxy-phosphogluconate aldolase [Rectinemataceae bacterium]
MASELKAAFPAIFAERLKMKGVIAVLVIDDPEKAVPVARILVEAGIDAMELALRTPSSLESLGRIVEEVPEMLAGVGTVLRAEQVWEAKEKGASFIVTPGTNRAVIEAALHHGMPIAPGIAVPSDIETALEYGCRILKIFPAESLGGLPYLRAINAPYAHLGIRYIPLGGVSEVNCGSYLAEPAVLAVGGSWIAPREAIQKGNWDAIRASAVRAAGACNREGKPCLR